jgi:hypothetical protein
LAQLFPKWTNKIPFALTVGSVVAVIIIIAGLWYFGSPQYTDVGYRPAQPVPYSHKLHAGDMGMDCRYCHTNVEVSPVANIPSTQTCMNCHTLILPNSENLAPVRDSWESGEPIEWVKVHMLPDYAYFNHSAHVTAGVGCESCHGNVAEMEKVEQVETLSMGWCLDCHRNPEPHLRPLDQITTMGYQPPEEQVAFAQQFIQEQNINPPTDCSACHR